MTKKWVTILGISILAVSLTACGNADENSDSPNGQSEQHEQTPNDEQEPNENGGTDLEDETPPESDENEDPEEEEVPETPKVEIDDPAIAVLVNKEYGLAEDFVPEDLVTVEVPTVLENPEVKQMRKVAADALKEMFDVAKESGIILHARSGYRSYQTQVQLFNNYASRHGEEAANRYSARPGHSEHQTGLVMDITSESVNFQLTEKFGETEEGKWVQDHAHEFGFIIRYPKDREDITGYIYEPWHLRYLGVDLATKVYESGLTYEEFLEEEGILLEVIAQS